MPDSDFKVGVGPNIPTLAYVSMAYVQHVLMLFRGNKSQAAKALGIDRRSLYRWLAKIHKIEKFK